MRSLTSVFYYKYHVLERLDGLYHPCYLILVDDFFLLSFVKIHLFYNNNNNRPVDIFLVIGLSHCCFVHHCIFNTSHSTYLARAAIQDLLP